MQLDKNKIIEDIQELKLKANEFGKLLDVDTQGHFFGIFNWIDEKKDDLKSLRTFLVDMTAQTKKCISSTIHFVPEKQKMNIESSGHSFIWQMELIKDDIDRLDFLPYCLYYDGTEKENNRCNSNEEKCRWWEEMYVNMFPTPEKRKRWEDYAKGDCILEFPCLTDILINTNVPIETKGIAAFIAVDYVYHTSGYGVEFVKDYGKGIIKPMDKYIWIDGNAYTAEENHWKEGGNTGLLPQRITPSIIKKLKKKEVFVFGSNFNGYHKGGAAKAAMNNYGAIWGVGEGLQGQSYAIPTTDGLDALKFAIERFTSFAKQHQELIFYVTPIGCGNAGYKPEDVALFFRDAALEDGNVNLPLSFWKEIVNHPTTHNEFTESVTNLIEAVKYMHRHNKPYWSEDTDDKIVDTLDRCFKWELGLQLGVISPTEEEPNTYGLPDELELKIKDAFRVV